MSQLTIYLDQTTLRRVRSAARREHSSVSRWVKSKLDKALQDSWPKNYFSLFGTLRDEDLVRPEPLDWNLDRRKESL